MNAVSETLMFAPVPSHPLLPRVLVPKIWTQRSQVTFWPSESAYPFGKKTKFLSLKSLWKIQCKASFWMALKLLSSKACDQPGTTDMACLQIRIYPRGSPGRRLSNRGDDGFGLCRVFLWVCRSASFAREPSSNADPDRTNGGNAPARLG